MKKILFLGVTLLVFSCNYDAEFDKLNEGMGELQQKIDQLNTDMTALKEGVAEINNIEIELNSLAQTIATLDNSSILSNLTEGLTGLQNELTIIKQTMGADNTQLVERLQALEDELALVGVDDVERADALALQIEELSSQIAGIDREDEYTILLTRISSLDEDLDELLSSAGFYNGNVSIRSGEDLDFYQNIMGDAGLQYINGYLEVEARSDIQILSIASPEDLSDFTRTIKGVTRSVYLSVDGPLDLSALESVGGIYRVHGADVLDENIKVVGGMVLDYDGDYAFPNLRQVNTYTFNIEDGLDEGISYLATQLIPLELLLGQSGLDGNDELQNVSYDYGAILMNTLDREVTEIDFSALEVPARVYTPRVPSVPATSGPIEALFSILFSLGQEPGVLALQSTSIKLGKAYTGYVVAPKAETVELYAGNFADFGLFPFEEEGTYYGYPGDFADIDSGIYPEQVKTKIFQDDRFTGYYGVWVLANPDNGTVTLSGESLNYPLLIIANSVVASELTGVDVQGDSHIWARNINMPNFSSLSGEEDVLYLYTGFTEENTFKNTNINGFTGDITLDEMPANINFNTSILTKGRIRLNYEDIDIIP